MVVSNIHAVKRVCQLPENKIMTISEGRLVLRDRGPEEMINNARDILLFGFGDDGVKAAEAIHRNGAL